MSSRPLRRGVAASILLVAAPGLLPAFAHASRPTSWVVSGSLAGHYSNAVTWLNCPETGASGTARERATLDVKIHSGKPAIYEGTGIALTMRMTPGGSWSVEGSYPPRQELAEDAIGCGAQQPIRCGGPIMGERGGGLPVLGLTPSGSHLLGNFLANDYFKESLTGEACELQGASAGPLLGLDDTLIEADAFVENPAHTTSLTIPRTRFRAGRPFTVMHSAGPDGGCNTPVYTHCEEAGKITLTLHFRRVH